MLVEDEEEVGAIVEVDDDVGGARVVEDVLGTALLDVVRSKGVVVVVSIGVVAKSNVSLGRG
eukprot:1050440-Rhodomonas_salina.1